MGSKKASARAKQKAAFMAATGGMDDIFSREERRTAEAAQQKAQAQKDKACTSKARYASKADALETILLCEKHGKQGLSCYRCPHCGGWHLTSHPFTQ